MFNWSGGSLISQQTITTHPQISNKPMLTSYFERETKALRHPRDAVIEPNGYGTYDQENEGYCLFSTFFSPRARPQDIKDHISTPCIEMKPSQD